MGIADWSVVAASVLAVFTLLPQISRIHRTGHVAGLTVMWPSIAAVTSAGWACYVLSQGLVESAASCAAMVVVYSVLAIQLVVRRVPWRRAAGVATAWTVVLALLAAVDATIGSTLLGFVLAFSYVVQAGPAVWAAWRDPAPTGVSAASWSIFLVEVALWGVYGIANSQPPIVTFAALGLTAATAMLVRRWVTRAAVATAMSTPQAIRATLRDRP